MTRAANSNRLPSTAAVTRPVALAGLDQAERECRSITDSFHALWEVVGITESGSRYDLTRVLASTELWTEERCAATLRLFDDSPAGEDEIATQLMILVGCFPNATRANLRIYSEQLAEDVNSVSPGCMALRLAMRNLRRTSTFLPAIAEVLRELDNARVLIDGARHRLARFPALRDKARAELQRTEAWYASRGGA